MVKKSLLKSSLILIAVFSFFSVFMGSARAATYTAPASCMAPQITLHGNATPTYKCLRITPMIASLNCRNDGNDLAIYWNAPLDPNHGIIP